MNGTWLLSSLRLSTVALCSVVFAACGTTAKCAPGNCSGCCDLSGQCQNGNTNSACGTGGLLCNSCNGALNCQLGFCSGGTAGGGTTGGGAASGGGAGGGTTGGGLGGGTGGGATGGGTIGTAYETWCNAYLADYCAYAQRCGSFGTTAACVASFSVYPTLCQASPAMKDGRVSFNALAAADCRNALTTLACDVTSTACDSIVRGVVGLNGQCFEAGECSAGLVCDKSATCPGRCVAATPLGSVPTIARPCAIDAYRYGGLCTAYLALGQSCAPTSGETIDRECELGLMCAPGTKVCSTRRRTAETCTPDSSECGGVNSCLDGVCQPPVGLNGQCDATRRCRTDLRCGEANVCVPLSTVNGPCNSTFSDCEPGLICTRTLTCQRIKRLGETCTSTADVECGLLGDLFCDGTVCARRKGVGASCASYAECVTFDCTNGVCAGCVDPTP